MTDDRVRVRYSPDAPEGAVELAGFLQAQPSVIEPGDTFTVPAETAERQYGDEGDARFAIVGDDEGDPFPDLNVASIRAAIDEHRERLSLPLEPLPRRRADLAPILLDLQRLDPPVPDQPSGEPAIGDQTPAASAEGDETEETL